MGKYIVKRLLWMIPIVLGVAVLVFTLMLFCPGNRPRSSWAVLPLRQR